MHKILVYSCILFLCPGFAHLELFAQQVAEHRHAHEQLHAVLWSQTSVEHEVVCVQAYALAQVRVEQALADRNWTAALEQAAGYEALPPAVILDVDETVLDNSAYQARLVRDNVGFDQKNWDRWVEEERAEAMPGVKDFLDYLSRRNIAAFFVTNREAAGEQATVNNLSEVLGFKITKDQVLCKKEQPAWDSDKATRREYLARYYRILLLVGDDYNDFVYFGKVAPTERVRQGNRYREYWGKKWIQLPNALYGNWEKSLFRYDYGMSDQEKLRLKYEAIETKSGPRNRAALLPTKNEVVGCIDN